MSKRSASVTAAPKPAKMGKGNVWDAIPDDDNERRFKPVEAGPKVRIQKVCVINYSPRVEACISLNGCYPEVRFTSPDGSFIMSGEEFLQMAGHTKGSRVMDVVRLEPVEEGYRLARYGQSASGLSDLSPTSVLEMDTQVVKRLKTRLESMCDHVCMLRDNEDVLRVMLECIVEVYKEQYQLLHTLTPITDLFMELTRLVETYVPQVMIVRSFMSELYTNKCAPPCFNHYSMLTCAMAQKAYLLECISKS